ncbi:hypothetical protein FACS1894211_11690 [Clostridia bacterium]|nr:hypothetical protein FACS1894211_11690 [Clostridia bacterium]
MDSKMEIVLNKEKIERDNIYDYGEFIVWLDSLCAEEGLRRESPDPSPLLYGSDNPNKAWGQVCVLVAWLEEIPEFVENCKGWYWLTEKYGSHFREDILAQINVGV